MKIMVVDDECRICRLLGEVLGKSGYDYVLATNGEDALVLYEEECPDLVILDVSMPGMDGFTLCEKLRDMGAMVPIIFLSAKGDIVDKGRGFSVGGDDYVVKPFDTQELLMRVAAHLRRKSRKDDAAKDSFDRGPFHFDLLNQELKKNGVTIGLTPQEFRTLAQLAIRPGEIMTKEQLIEKVWGGDYEGETTGLAVYVRKIRMKIEEDPSKPKYLKTIWRVGYCFTAD